jgi:hypothetical protein
MSTKVASLYAELSAKDGLTPALANAKGGLSNFAGGLKSGLLQLAGWAGGAALAGVAVEKFAKLMHEATDEAAGAQTSFVRLNATIESTGRAGETSAMGIRAMAESLQGLFTHEDIEGAANILLRFVDIPTEKIPEDIRLIENMAAAMGTDLASAAQTLGMALETGRTRGLGFSKELMNTITTMMTAGDVAGADALIMENLNQKFSGQAAAALETYAGKQQRINTGWGELKEIIGEKLLPKLQEFDDWLLRVQTHAGLIPQTEKELNTELASMVSKRDEWIAGGLSIDDPGLELMNAQIDALISKLMFLRGDSASWARGGQDAAAAWMAGIYPVVNAIKPPELKASEARDYSETMQKMYSANSVAQKNLSTYFDDYHKKQIDAALAEKKSAEEIAKLIKDEAEAMKYLHDETVKAHNAAMDMQTGFETAFTTAKTSSDKTAASFDVIGQMMQGMGDQGKDIWNEFLMQTGKISPAALEQFATIEVAMNNLRANLASGMTIKMAVQMAVGELQSAGVIPVAPAKNSPWKNLGQKSGSDTTPAWYNSTSEDWYFGNKPPGYASGGAFVVPSGYSNDNYLARFSSGERVTVTPPGQKTMGGNVVININGWQGDYRSLAREITYRQEVERLMQ